MLVLTRKKGQSLNIGGDIRIVLLEVSRDSVRIGIEAPPEVAVYRSEVYQSLQQENRRAVAPKNVISELSKLAGINRDNNGK